MNGANTVWTSLEIVKLIVSVLSPLVLIILGFWINRRLKRTEFLHWTNQKVIEKRLIIFDEIAPLLNDLYCFFTYVGRWKELNPPEMIEIKRNLDRSVHIYTPIFDPEFISHYTRFMDCCYLTYQGWGEDAKLRTEYELREEAAGKSWKQQWSSMFAEERADEQEIEASYQDLMSYLSRSLGIGLLEDRPATITTDVPIKSEVSSAISLTGDENLKQVREDTYPPALEESGAAKLTDSDLKGLENLQIRISRANIPKRAPGKTLNIATWNIREFGKNRRKNLSLHLIAEIIRQFDLIAISELRKDLREIERVRHILGPSWKMLYSDYSVDLGGNWDRMCYLYDERTINFSGLAAEVDTGRKKDAAGAYISQLSWWRKPYLASFSAGNYNFLLMTAHIAWEQEEKSQERALKFLAQWVHKRCKDRFAVEKDFILMGNFNIPSKDNALFEAITCKGLQIPTAIRGAQHGSNLSQNRRYDQILHYPSDIKSFTDNAGVLDFYAGGIKKLFPDSSMSKTEFTYQLSDHLPVWIQINMDLG